MIYCPACKKYHKTRIKAARCVMIHMGRGATPYRIYYCVHCLAWLYGVGPVERHLQEIGDTYEDHLRHEVEGALLRNGT